MKISEKAAALRAAQQSSERKQPEENGERLATIPRKEGDEIRLNWAEYNGHNFLNVRVWAQGEDGNWFPQKEKGLTVRVAELAGFAEGVEAALGRALGGAQTPNESAPKPQNAKSKPAPRARKRTDKTDAAPFNDVLPDILAAG